MEDLFHFKTISSSIENELIKEKNSKFIGFAFPINSQSDVKTILKEIKSKHQNANHLCYAYQLYENAKIHYRYNDDGEPNNSAGLPIYRQIQSFDTTNIIVVVIRYFGGTKLGVSGLINAYKNTAKQTLNKCDIITIPLTITKTIRFDYSSLSVAMRIIKKFDLKIMDQKMNENCQIRLQINKSDLERVLINFSESPKIKIS